MTVLCLASCFDTSKEKTGSPGTKKTEVDMSYLNDVYFAGGCFWGVEEYFSRIPGVFDVTVGYANGTTENPTYEQVCSGNTVYMLQPQHIHFVRYFRVIALRYTDSSVK